jgi:branched-chain amino acid aminotransferase
MSLCELATDMGLIVERRHIAIDELENFEEAGACGTAAIVSPIGMIQDRDTGHIYQYSKNGNVGSWCKKLYERLTGIQYGEIEDKFGWCKVLF